MILRSNGINRNIGIHGMGALPHHRFIPRLNKAIIVTFVLDKESHYFRSNGGIILYSTVSIGSIDSDDSWIREFSDQK